MAGYCIVPEVANKLKQAFRDGELSPQALHDASTEMRHAIFSEYMTPELAHEVNAAFEKALVSKQQSALADWAAKTLDPKAPQTKGIIDKIKELDAVLGDRSNDFLSDLVADKIGVTLTPEELKGISDRATKLEALGEARNPDTGSFTVDYWKAQEELQNYVLSLSPTSNLKIASGTVGRSNLLGIPSAVTNILSNMFPAGSMAVVRRINAHGIAGVNGDLVKSMLKEAHNIYNQAGVDITRLDSMNPRGELRLGEQIVHTEGPGAYRKSASVYSDIIFKYAQGYPDFASASLAFYDNLNLNATRVAKSMGLTGDALKAKAAELMKAANGMEPEGANLRAVAIADARMSTWTEGGIVGDSIMKLRGVADHYTGNAMGGTFFVPFVKQPATALQRGLEASGPGIFKAFIKWPEAIRQAKLGNSVPLLDVTKSLVEAGLGLTTAAIIAYSIAPDDFIPDYALASPKEKELVAAKGATFNSIKIGGAYISLDWLGWVAPALVGMLYARKMGPGGYIAGVIGAASRAPGISEAADAIGAMMQAGQENADLTKQGISIGGSLISSILARSILQSGTLSNIDKGTDVQRQTGSDFISKVIAGVPFLRRLNPEKINPITGEVMTNESLATMLIFGSRYKTATNDPVVNEISRLNELGAGPVIQSIQYSSGRISKLKEQITPKQFQKALEYFGKNYYSQATDLISESDYPDMTDEEKMKALNSVRESVINDTLSEFDFQEPDKTGTTAPNQYTRNPIRR